MTSPWSNDLDRKFTDIDVRKEPGLRELAKEFARHYQGDYPYLVQARQMVHQHGKLTTPLTRGILNCMRNDPDGTTWIQDFYSKAPMEADVETVGLDLRAVELERPAWVDMKATWKMGYVLSSHKLGKVAHLLRSEKSRVRWFPHTGDLELQPAVWCSKHVAANNFLSADEQGRPLCKNCDRNQKAYYEMFKDAHWED